MLPFIILIALHLASGHYGRHFDADRLSSLFEDFNIVTETMLPRFAEPIPNVTVTVGRDALLACVVDNLRSYKVAWVRVDTQTILSIHHNVITQNPRISLSYNDHRSWYLHIKNVQEIDRGWYMCQVNTDPMRMRQGYLQVVVPPRILERDTSTDLVVRESTNISLHCRAVGYPEPYVMWRREDGADINYNGDIVNVVDGELLHIGRVSRLHMGAYLCIASNGVPPSISKRVFLRVQFPPMLSIPNQLEGAYLGQDVSLECHTEAYPTSINYWTTEQGGMIVSGDKYEAVFVDNGYSKFMLLKIRSVSKDDFGSYQCIAKNSLGETAGVIKLDEIPAPVTKLYGLANVNMSAAINNFIGKGEGKSKSIERFSDHAVSDYQWQESEYEEFGFTMPAPIVPLAGFNSASTSCLSTSFLLLILIS